MCLEFEKETIIYNFIDNIDLYEGSTLEDIKNYIFNSDYYIIGIKDSIEALNKYTSMYTPLDGIFGAFNDIKYYMCDYLELYTEDELISNIGYDPEKTATTLAYCIADYFLKEICNHTNLNETTKMTKDKIEIFIQAANDIINSNQDFLDNV